MDENELRAALVDAPLLGEGMERRVYGLGPQLVAAVWRQTTGPRPENLSFGAKPQFVKLQTIQAFYQALAGHNLPFSTPLIHEIHELDGGLVTVEQRLTGQPLSAAMAEGRIDGVEAIACTMEVLDALSNVGQIAEAKSLAMLDGEPSTQPFAQRLRGLLNSRAERFCSTLGPAVRRLEEKVQALDEFILSQPANRCSVIHGDLFPGNLLVQGNDPSAVLDWGFMTTEGDPAFDAAISASIFDMYGPDALNHERNLMQQVETRLGYCQRTLLGYRAAYSLITANAYDPDGTDGHFAWCVAGLNRPDIEAALGC